MQKQRGRGLQAGTEHGNEARLLTLQAITNWKWGKPENEARN